jgi:hypothetical protein
VGVARLGPGGSNRTATTAVKHISNSI